VSTLIGLSIATYIEPRSSVVSADPTPNSPYLSEFQPRPITDRRAASIHAHIDGETGPELADVVNASLRALRMLLGRCNAAQVAIVFDSILQHIDTANMWGNTAAGQWYAEHVIDWAQYQYRYAVPSQLVDRLLAIQDSPSSKPKHFALVDMLTSIFTSSTPLINLSTSDVISSLITVLLWRVNIDPTDQLLPPLVECISSLGTHVYYADQIHDLAEEVVNRIVNVQVNGVLGRGRAGNGQARETALRCLLSCLSGLSEAADRHAAKYNAKLADDVAGTPTEAGDGDRPPSESTSTTARAARRNKVSPESWQETLALLCESDYGIRAMYARGLAAFIRGEVKKEPFVLQEDKTPTRRNVKVVVDPEFKVSSRPSILAADPISRFLNALHATAFTLATSASGHSAPPDGAALSPAQNDSTTSPPYSANINVVPPSNSNLPTPNLQPSVTIDFIIKPPSGQSSANGDDGQLLTAVSAESAISSIPAESDLSPVHEPGKRHSRHQNGSRKLSVALSMLDGSHMAVNTMLSDFSLLQHVFICVHQQVPTRAVLTGVPMLLALDKQTRKMTEAGQHHVGSLRAIRELVCHVWIVIGEVWDVLPIVESAKAVSGFQSAPSTS
jgi:protein EFR3